MLLELAQSIIRANGEMFGLLTFFVGLGLGHWLALGRDRRREFNDAALPVREWLLRQIKRPSPISNAPTPIELDRFIQCLQPWRRRGFCMSYKKQEREREKALTRDQVGSIVYNEETPIVLALRKCLSYTNRK